LGQKTHPVGFRLGFNKTWSSNWFDEKNFADKLNEDILLRKYIYSRLAHAAVDKIDIHRTSKKITISISTARPGIVIGRKGEEVDPRVIRRLPYHKGDPTQDVHGIGREGIRTVRERTRRQNRLHEDLYQRAPGANREIPGGAVG